MTRPSPLRLAWLIALLCAVSLRLLTPPGWMPNLDGRDGGALVICTSDGVKSLHSADPARHGPAGKAGHDLCAFAGLALHAAPAVALAAPSRRLLAASAPLRPDQTGLAPARRRPQAARAPPLFA